MTNFDDKNIITWFKVFRDFLLTTDKFLGDFIKHGKEYEDKLKGIDFTSPSGLTGLNELTTEQKAPLLLSLFGEITSFASLMGKFQGKQAENDVENIRKSLKKMISNIDKLLEGL